ncbi:hypothetical protein ACFVXE_33995 [Streptomyces sp. NPDC058231]|uniref:hypothetical protein n=1 Tax=Streptomyces sp. NPDC058231 TaxID=3346392 RepID=UPI0036E1DB94
MSYDIYFLSRRPDQSWDEALEELEDQNEEVEGLVLPELIEAWDRIVPRARGLLGEIGLFENGETCELTHHATGIQASVFIDEVAITVPYWHVGDEAERILSLVYALAAVIEDETGMEGYDPQVERPISELSPQQGVTVMSAVTGDLRKRFGNDS